MSEAPHSSLEIGLIGGIEKREIKIVPWRSEWRDMFHHHAERVQAALGPTLEDIEHIGSTSVAGLAAKPIIDVLAIVQDPSREDRYLTALQAAGYQLRVREPAFDEHRMFRTPKRDVHIHVFPPDSAECQRYLLFRDYLRNCPETRDRYANLKRELSLEDWEDMNAYAEAKTAFIEQVIRLARQKDAPPS